MSGFDRTTKHTIFACLTASSASRHSHQQVSPVASLRSSNVIVGVCRSTPAHEPKLPGGWAPSRSTLSHIAEAAADVL